MKRLLFVLAATVGACSTQVAFDAEGFKCDPGASCPDGYSCVEGYCHSEYRAGGGAGGSAGGGAGGGCVGSSCADGGDLCAGVVCNAPPADTCVDPSTLRTFATSGTCNPSTGACSYAPTDSACATGCASGSCPGSLCVNVTCNAPPSPSCDDPSTLRTYSSPGSCAPATGQCSYSSTPQTCPNGCLSGACVPASLTFKQSAPGINGVVTAVDQVPGSLGQHVIAVGLGGLVMKWNGSSWTQLSSGTTNDLFAVSLFSGATPGGYIAGAAGTLLRYDGQTGLTPITVSGLTADLVSVSAATSDVALAGGGTQIVVHSQGAWALASLTDGSLPASASNITSVLAEVSATRMRATGSCTTITAATGGPCVVELTGGTPPTGVVTIDNGASVAGFSAIGPDSDTSSTTRSYVSAGASTRMFSATGFSNAQAVTVTTGAGITALSSGGAGVVWALSPPTTAAFGALFRSVLQGNGTMTTSPLLVLFGQDAAMGRVDSGGIMLADIQNNAANITRRSATTDESYDLGEDWVGVDLGPNGYSLANSGGDVGQPDPTKPGVSHLFRYPNPVNVLDAAGTDPMIMVGDNGLVLRFATANCGTNCFSTLNALTSRRLRSVCRVSDTLFYAVGDNGTIVKVSGTSGAALTASTMTNNVTNVNLYDVRCDASGGAIAVGDSGAMLVLTNGAWTAMPFPPPNSPNLRSVATANNVIFATTGTTTLQFTTGNGWSTLPSRSGVAELQTLDGVRLYAATGSTVSYFDGISWSTALTAPASLIAGASSGSTVVFAGNSGVVVEGQ